jgi:hypothetical protein
MKLEEIDIHEVGNTVQIAGAVFQGQGSLLLCMFPACRGEVRSGDVLHDSPEFVDAETGEDYLVEVLDMDVEDWNRFLRQTDVLETKVLAEAEDGKLVKAVLRKTARQISAQVSWDVFRRDGFRCRYCGREDVPLTVDHLVLWEEGGPSVAENLLAACKKCNRKRGSTPYAEWLEGPRYRKTSEGLDPGVRQANLDLVPTLASIPRSHHKKSHR